MKENIKIFLRGMMILVFSLIATTCFIVVPWIFKEFMNATGLWALLNFFLMLGIFITGCGIIFALGIDSVYSDESIEKEK